MLDYSRLDEATLRLFKGLLDDGANDCTLTADEVSELVMNGLLFNNMSFFSRSRLANAMKAAIDLYGKNPYKLSNTFHKNWNTVEAISVEEHYLQTIISYITTYGYDALGIPYDESHYILPEEVIEVPENVAPCNFIVINSFSEEEITKRIQALVGSGVALSQQQVDDVLTLINILQLNIDFSSVKNKEVGCALWLGIKGDKPYINVDEFLRVLIYVVTKGTLLIRSYRNYQMIKYGLSGFDRGKANQVSKLMKDYERQFGLHNLAGSFLRNKMLFLAFKCPETKSQINHLRRVADKYNKPLENVRLSEKDILRAGENGNVFQLVKYYNYCLSMINPTEDKLYTVRNGKNYLATNANYFADGAVKRLVDEHFTKLLNVIKDEMFKLLSHLSDKTFILPDYLDYKVPSSLKRLASGVPEGSTFLFDEDSAFTIGVHWKNIANKRGEQSRVDLDLHASSLSGRSIGWNTSFRNDEVLYSGDIVDAPISKGGASEALLFRHVESPYLVTLNSYNQAGEIPYKFIFDIEEGFKETSISSSGWGRREPNGYIFTPNARVLNAKIKKDGSQNTLGLVLNNKFYFVNSSLFTGSVTHNSELLKRAIVYYEESQKNSLSFRQLAEMLGARVINSKDFLSELLEDEAFDESSVIDLSLEAITEDTFVTLFTENN